MFDREETTLVEEMPQNQLESSYSRRPTWFKDLDAVDSINRMNVDELFDSLGMELNHAEPRKTSALFEITNDAYEYSGLLRMLQSNRDDTTEVST